ncbi:ABC transporter permease subunit [Acrocarpospora sp. B8E8]|uniref:ABC transporter permease subunit n=1 Tax=Acrocarpospora sp. B8E8 TaxID=3153572 RepID=UPI00325DF947
MPALMTQSLREYRRALIGWTIGISVFMSIYIGIYASIKESPEVYGPAALAKYPGALKDLMGGLADFTSGPGFLQSVVYQLFVPMLFIACACGIGNRAIAQPEESGLLELTVTLPIERVRLLLQRFGAGLLGLLAAAVLTYVIAWAIATNVGVGVPADRILAAHTGVFLLGLFFGTLTLAVGAATGRKGLASAVAGVWAIGGYAVVTIGQNVSAISWLKWVSPFHYYLEGKPIYQGFPVGDYLVLAGATAVLLLTAALAFDRRDVGV